MKQIFIFNQFEKVLFFQERSFVYGLTSNIDVKIFFFHLNTFKNNIVKSEFVILFNE